MDTAALIATFAHEPDPTVASRNAGVALVQVGLIDPEHPRPETPLRPADELTDAQREVLVAIATRGDLPVGGHGLPVSNRLRRRWLGLDAPTPLEKLMPWMHEGRAVQWPVWRVWTSVPKEALEYNQGIPVVVVDFLSATELLEASCEALLERYGIGWPVRERLCAVLARPTPEMVAWARTYADRLLALHPGIGKVGLGPWSTAGASEWYNLGWIVLEPLARAGVPIEARWDVLVPYTQRVILAALPPERREAVVFHHLSTDWGLPYINGLGDGMSVVDLAPSERVAAILVLKLRNPRNRGFLKKWGPIHRTTLEDLAKTEPGVAAALKPRRNAKARERTPSVER